MDALAKFSSIGVLISSTVLRSPLGVDSYLDEFNDTIVFYNIQHSTLTGFTSKGSPDSLVIPMLHLSKNKTAEELQMLIKRLRMFESIESDIQKTLKELYWIFVKGMCPIDKFKRKLQSKIFMSKIKFYGNSIKEFESSVLMKISEDQKELLGEELDVVSYFIGMLYLNNFVLGGIVEDLCSYDRSGGQTFVSKIHVAQNFKARFTLDAAFKDSMDNLIFKINLLRQERKLNIKSPYLEQLPLTPLISPNERKLKYLLELRRITDVQVLTHLSQISTKDYGHYRIGNGCQYDSEYRKLPWFLVLRIAAENKVKILHGILETTMALLNQFVTEDLPWFIVTVHKCLINAESLKNKLKAICDTKTDNLATHQSGSLSNMQFDVENLSREFLETAKNDSLRLESIGNKYSFFKTSSVEQSAGLEYLNFKPKEKKHPIDLKSASLLLISIERKQDELQQMLQDLQIILQCKIPSLPEFERYLNPDLLNAVNDASNTMDRVKIEIIDKFSDEQETLMKEETKFLSSAVEEFWFGCCSLASKLDEWSSIIKSYSNEIPMPDMIRIDLQQDMLYNIGKPIKSGEGFKTAVKQQLEIMNYCAPPLLPKFKHPPSILTLAQHEWTFLLGSQMYSQQRLQDRLKSLVIYSEQFQSMKEKSDFAECHKALDDAISILSDSNRTLSKLSRTADAVLEFKDSLFKSRGIYDKINTIHHVIQDLFECDFKLQYDLVDLKNCLMSNGDPQQKLDAFNQISRNIFNRDAIIEKLNLSIKFLPEFMNPKNLTLIKKLNNEKTGFVPESMKTENNLNLKPEKPIEAVIQRLEDYCSYEEETYKALKAFPQTVKLCHEIYPGPELNSLVDSGLFHFMEGRKSVLKTIKEDVFANLSDQQKSGMEVQLGFLLFFTIQLHKNSLAFKENVEELHRLINTWTVDDFKDHHVSAFIRSTFYNHFICTIKTRSELREAFKAAVKSVVMGMQKYISKSNLGQTFLTNSKIEILKYQLPPLLNVQYSMEVQLPYQLHCFSSTFHKLFFSFNKEKIKDGREFLKREISVLSDAQNMLKEIERLTGITKKLIGYRVERARLKAKHTLLIIGKALHSNEILLKLLVEMLDSVTLVGSSNDCSNDAEETCQSLCEKFNQKILDRINLGEQFISYLYDLKHEVIIMR